MENNNIKVDDMTASTISEAPTTYEVGQEVEVQITKIVSYGAFAKTIKTETAESCSGLIHISQFCENFVRDPNNYFDEGDKVKAKILEIELIDGKERLKLSTKDYGIKPKQQKEDSYGSRSRNARGFRQLDSKINSWINNENNK